MKIGFIAGWPPEDKQGESNYAYKIITEYKKIYKQDVINVFAHVNKKTSKKFQYSIGEHDNILIRRVTNGSNFFSRSIRSLVLPFIILKSGCRVVHYQGVHTPLYGGLFGETMLLNFFILRIFGVKQFYSLHSTWMKEDLNKLVFDKKKGRFSSYLFRKYYWFYLKAVYFFMNKVFVVSCGNKDVAVNAFLKDWGLKSSKTFKENHPCHLGEETENFNTEKFEKNILCLGYVREDKGLHYLIDAFERIAVSNHNLRLVIGGEPIGKEGEKYVEYLKEKIKKSPISKNIRYIDGYIEQTQFQNLFNTSSVVVIPYARSIGPSGPIHYALGRKKIVVASNIGHNSNLPDLVCLYNSVEDLPEALLKALNNDEYTFMLRENIDKYIKKNSWYNMAVEYNKYYKQ